jgi:TonB family protein
VEEKKQEQMIEEVKPDEAPPEATPQVETALKGSGNSGMVLKSGNGSGVFNRGNTVSAERMRWSAYAGQVKSRIGQVLESNPKTRKARMTIVVHVWLDDTGRITRAKLDGSTGDSAVDAAIRDEILPGLQISGAPPQGMPMPINMRITARRPN